MDLKIESANKTTTQMYLFTIELRENLFLSLIIDNLLMYMYIIHHF